MAGEANLQTKIMTDCKTAGILAYKTEAVGQRGFPDVLLLKAAVIVFLELKNPNGKGSLEPHQKRIRKKFIEQGANIYVINTYAQWLTIKSRHYP